ncbi:helix-turn-helix transcriptional regulator [Catellatospora paridis]
MPRPRTTTQSPFLPGSVRDFLAEQAPFLAGVAVQAPGGHGKSTVLRELARAHGSAGVTVIDHRLDRSTPHTSDSVLLVDDAHALDPDSLRGLRELLTGNRCRLVVAYRPWPRPAALAELADVLRRHGPPLTLGPFGEEQTSALLTAVLGDAATPATVRFVHTQAGGVPGHVDRLARALAGAPDHRRAAEPVDLPAAALAPFAADLDDAGADVRRLLLAAASGVDLPLAVACELLGRTADELDAMHAAARAAGLLGPSGRLSPIVRHAIVAHSPTDLREDVWQRLAEIQLQRGGAALPVVRVLRRAGLADAHLTGPLAAAADEVLADEPALAADLLAAAVAAGGRASPARWARAAALTGDLDVALRLADRALAEPDPAVRAEAAMVTAAALAHRGQLGRSADLYRWSDTAGAAAFAAIAATATGRPELLDAAADQRPAAPPTLLTSASVLMAQGLRETLTGSPTAALSSLTQAAALLEPAGRAELLPDSPAALAAVVGLHCCEFDLSSSVLARAVRARIGGSLLTRRHRLLQAWIHMMRGQTAAAAAILDATARHGTALEPRDQLFATALEVGVARRNSDLPALLRGWERAREALMRHPVDLFTLLPLGEFTVAAARAGEPGLVREHLREAHLLLGRLGDPPLWAAPLHWSSLHAAIVAEDETAAAELVAALARVRHTRFGSAVAGAAESWWQVWHGVVDLQAVETAARRLHGVGLPWDAARLAGQAAIRTADRRTMTTLLDYARLLQPKPDRPAATDSEPAPAGRPDRARDTNPLTAREQEVADLVLAGLTYRQIGEKLFISAKTVEHHMARIRRRLGCDSRSELLARLRSMASGPLPTPVPGSGADETAVRRP